METRIVYLSTVRDEKRETYREWYEITARVDILDAVCKHPDDYASNDRASEYNRIENFLTTASNGKKVNAAKMLRNLFLYYKKNVDDYIPVTGITKDDFDVTKIDEPENSNGPIGWRLGTYWCENY